MSLLSNQIKIKTNVGRTELIERATYPNYSMSPTNTAPDINIVNHISEVDTVSEDEEIWICLTFVCLKSWENACIWVKNKLFIPRLFCAP